MVNINKQVLTSLQQEILRLLFVKSGMSLNQRGIARILEVTPPAVMKAIPKLEEEKCCLSSIFCLFLRNLCALFILY